MSLESFGKEIRRLRKEKNLSQRKLAKEAEINATYLSKIENGKNSYYPSDEVIGRLAKLLEADLIAFSDKISKEAYEDYIFLVKMYPEIINLTKEMLEDPDFADHILAQSQMQRLL
ncbi:MAG: helix-turn-helix domain-containing protein [Okeania sp. SIO2D1]|nr:helix-turn-helix domain-containing protein [Okeania sp. SIO2D1]